MKSIGHFLGSRAISGSTRLLSAEDEAAALQDAMASATLILNDDFDSARESLSKGSSPFHKLGLATLGFLRAVIGFEQDMMKEAGELLVAAEASAAEHQRSAQKNGYRSSIYPPGSEYALVYAESQLMSAVVGVLNESVTEAIKGFYRLRRAYATLQELAEAEKRYIRAKNTANGIASSGQSVNSRPSSAIRSNHLSPPAPNGTASTSPSGGASPLARVSASNIEDADSDSDLDFVDADDTLKPTRRESYTGHLTRPTSHETNPPPLANLHISSSPTTLEVSDLTNPIDLFTHTGTALCFGLLNLLLSLIPPTFSRLLSIVGFRGSGTLGLQLLWSATDHAEQNVNGALAALIVLGYHSNMIGIVDILDPDAYPKQRCADLLLRMRKRFPASRFWLLEEARMVAAQRRPDVAVELLLRDARPAPLKQVEALRWFECSLNWMFTGEWLKCAEGFLKCADLNNWSPALYRYIAASAYLELYRATLMEPVRANEGQDDSMTRRAKAARYRSRAAELFRQVPDATGKKRFMARQLPFDAYVARKVAKWEARSRSAAAAAWGRSKGKGKDEDEEKEKDKEGTPKDLVDFVGVVAPMQEMIYFWSGWMRMRDGDLAGYERRLDEGRKLVAMGDGRGGDWQGTKEGGEEQEEEETEEEEQEPEEQGLEESLEGEDEDEVLVYWVLKAVVLEKMGRRHQARSILESRLAGLDFGPFRDRVGPRGETWALPAGAYELAVCDWADYRALVAEKEEEEEEAGEEGPGGAKATEGQEEKEGEEEEGRSAGGRSAATAQELLASCAARVERVARWAGYDLDARLGMKIRGAQETFRRVAARG